MPNIEGGDTRPTQLSTFDVRRSLLDVSPFLDERSQIRLPPITEEPRFHGGGRAHAGARHRSDDRYFQCGLCRRAAAIAVPGFRTACRGLDSNPAVRPTPNGGGEPPRIDVTSDGA